ncbi:MAG: hypothetical protein ACJ74O_13635 [Frankiaceae bacterium]
MSYRVGAERAETVALPDGRRLVRPRADSQCHLLRDGKLVCDIPRPATPVDETITWDLLMIGQHCPVCSALTANGTE